MTPQHLIRLARKWALEANRRDEAVRAAEKYQQQAALRCKHYTDAYEAQTGRKFPLHRLRREQFVTIDEALDRAMAEAPEAFGERYR